MRRYGWLLLAAVFAISGGVGYVYYQAKLLQASEELGIGMAGLDIAKIPEGDLMQTRGW